MPIPTGCNWDRCRRRGFYTCAGCGDHCCRKHRMKVADTYYCRLTCAPDHTHGGKLCYQGCPNTDLGTPISA